MAEKLEPSRLSLHQIAQSAFDEDRMASRVHLIDADIAMELNAEDGDSVISVSKTGLIEVNPDDVLDFSLVSKICVFQSGIVLKLLDDDNQVLWQYSLASGFPLEIMAKNVKFECQAPIKVMVK